MQLLVLAGPTGTGKTELSLRLAAELKGEIISADSTQVYKGMDLATAKLLVEERSVPHYLIDLVNPDQEFTLYDYQKLAFKAIGEIAAKGKLPILAGGSGLYIKAVTEGLNLPYAPPEPEFRRKLREREEQASGTLHRELLGLDPPTAGRLHPNDLRRIIRALEVCHFTGKPFSEFYTIPLKHPLGLKSLKLGLTVEKKTLYRRLEERVFEQLSAGLLNEVKDLLAKGYEQAIFQKNPLGYPEMVRHLKGELGLAEAVAIFQKRNRNLAKKQMTWFRADPEIIWFKKEDFLSPEELINAMLLRVKNWLKEGEE